MQTCTSTTHPGATVVYTDETGCPLCAALEAPRFDLVQLATMLGTATDHIEQAKRLILAAADGQPIAPTPTPAPSGPDLPALKAEIQAGLERLPDERRRAILRAQGIEPCPDGQWWDATSWRGRRTATVDLHAAMTRALETLETLEPEDEDEDENPTPF